MGWRKRLGTGVAVLAAATAAVGVLHMPFARGLLMRAGGCPFGQATLAQLEPARLAAVRSTRGSEAAPVRPALGFDLDRTTRKDLDAWADRAHVSCGEVREGLVFCKDVPAAALGMPAADGPVQELHLGFNTQGHLVDVATMRMHVARTETVRDVEKQLEAQVGAPHRTSGAFDDAHLAAEGPASLASTQYHYRDYVAEVMAARFSGDGLVLREHYMSAND
jgi:hypothetical protein